jgi:hypothetical protein
MLGLPLQAALLWLSCPVLQLFCVYLLYRRKLLKQFSLFASYLLFLTLLNIVRFICFRQFGLASLTYYAVYWASTALGEVGIIAVLYEIFCAALSPFAGLHDLAKIVFKWAAVSMLFIGLVIWLSRPVSSAGATYHWIASSIQDFERIVGVMEITLLILLFIGSQQLGISMRGRVFGCALGFGVNALFGLVIYIALVTYKSKTELWSQLLPVGYYACLLIWAGYLVKSDSSVVAAPIPVSSPLLRWNEIALRLGHSGGKVAFINPEPYMPDVQRIMKPVLPKEFVERRNARYQPHTD